MLAVVGGLVFAIPWAAQVAAAVGGDLGGRPVLWHELHAIAGVAFALSLLELRRRYRGWFTPSGRIALALAVASAAAFALANLGEVLALGEVFVPLYGISLLALSVALIGVAVSTPTLPRPVPVLLLFTGIAFPATLPLNVLPAPAGPIAAAASLLGYGLLWAVLGFVQLSRIP
jgi:hypothetical protein